MSPPRTVFRHSWPPSTRWLGLVSIVLAFIALVPLVHGPRLFAAVALSLLAIGGLGGVTYERRRNARRALVRSISCWAAGRHAICDTRTLDLSLEGFFVETTTPYPLLTRFRFELTLVPNEHPIQGQGVVRWINRHAPEGMGIEIVKLDEPERFRQYLENELHSGVQGERGRSSPHGGSSRSGDDIC